MDKEQAEAINFQRVCRLLIDKGRDAFRAALHVKHQPSTLAEVLDESKKTLQKLRYTVIQPCHWKLLFPATGIPDSKTFDLTLLTVLLQTICGLRPPATGWDVMPPDSDNSISANIARIKLHRNQLCGNMHRGQLDNQMFEISWEDISKTLVSLGIPQQHIDELKQAPFTSDDKRLIEELQEWKEREDELSKLGDDEQNAGASGLSSKDLKTKMDKEALNYFRVYQLLVQKGGDALRAALHAHIPAPNLSAELNSKKGILRKLMTTAIRPSQWDLLFPVQGTPDSRDFDITLLTILLRNICGLPPPVTGWEKTPPDSDTSKSADILRIKKYRDKLLRHSSSAKLDDVTFEMRWREISKTLVKLGIPQYDIDKLKTAPISSQQTKTVMEQEIVEAFNFFRVCRLLIDKGGDALRTVLHMVHPPSTLARALNAARPSLMKIRYKIIRHAQWDLLFPSSGTPDSKTFDLTLLTILLRHICQLQPPPTGWNVMPPISDTSISANVVRIKTYRNEVLAHPSRATMDDKTFNILWQEIARTLVKLGIPRQEIDELKEVSSVTEEKSNYTEELQEWKEKEADLSNLSDDQPEAETSVLTAEKKKRLALLYVQNGYDEKQFATKVSDDMICGICKDVVNKPKGCCNRHFFCSNCINRSLLEKTSCPLCRVALTPETLQDPPQDMIHSLSELRIHCDYQERGCDVVVLLKDLQTHVDKCEFAPKDPAEMLAKLKVSEHGDGKDLETSSIARPEPPKQETLEVLTVEEHNVIVLGGCLVAGNNINSVQMYIFTERTWIELPSMITPRSKLSSVLVDNEIVVSGGNFGAEPTASIEIMKLNETPRRWRMSDATLPEPLSGHCTVVYEGKLIVIGGYDGYTGRISNKIYEISLIPNYSCRCLGTLPQAVSGHRTELVDGKIFIFGGRSLAGIPNNQVWMYDLTTNECNPMPPLPYPVMDLATVRRGRKVILLGGVGALQQELDRVIMYDIQTGETRNVSRMRQRRGGCSAVLTADTLVALGSLHGDNTVECSRINSATWNYLPNTNVARAFCAAVVSPINFRG